MAAPIGQTAQGIVLGHPAQQLTHQELLALGVLVQIATDGTDDQQQRVIADRDPVLRQLCRRQDQVRHEHVQQHDQ